MTPGLGFFYAGLSRERNAITVIYQSFISLGIIFCLWCMVGFSLTFGTPCLSLGGYHVLGNPMDFWMLDGVDIYQPLQRAGAVVAPFFPGMLFMAFQAMFAVITPCLISGAFTDRLRFGAYNAFICLWHILVYAPLAFWNFGGGWMFQIGAWDFAGGIVVHEAAGFSALGALLALGRRKRPPIPLSSSPHNIPMMVFGTGIVWFGWFGFNGGSALSIGGLATIAFVNTQMAPAAAMVAWIGMDWCACLRYNVKKPTLVGLCTGAIAGLVVITPSAGFMQPSMAMAVGFVGGVTCWLATYFITYHTNLDDACYTIGVHGVGGFLGTVFVGIFSDPPECTSNDPPRYCANPHTCTRGLKQTGVQILCAVVSALYCTAMTYFMLKMFLISGVRKLVRHEDQALCQDWEEFGEVAYRRPMPEEGEYDPSEKTPYALVVAPPWDTDSEEEGGLPSGLPGKLGM